jgi:mRNA interferase YafQ
MAYSVRTTKRFDKSVEKMKKRGLPMDDLRSVISLLMQTGTLPAHYRPHKLSGRYNGKWECHIKGDWLLVWEQHDDELLLVMIDTGSHSDIF